MEKNKNTEKKSSEQKNNAAVYSLWFGLDYGSILTSYALYKALEKMSIKPYLIQKQPELWGDHYADKDNIAGKFILNNCDVLEIFDKDDDKKTFENIRTHVIGSDIMWNKDIVGKQSGHFYFGSGTSEESSKVAYGTSFGGSFNAFGNELNDYAVLLKKFSAISSKDTKDAEILRDNFYIDPEYVIDPVFLCNKEDYIKCAEKSVAKTVETENKYIWTYIKNGDERKRKLLLRGNNILLENKAYPLRNFIDINRYPESLKALGLDAAYHILTEDWLYYLINSEFVITDDYYGMCFAIIFEKPFVVMGSRDMSDITRYTSLLKLLDLQERMVYMSDDFKKKEYLFRKPIRYNKVNKKLEELRLDSLKWLKDSLKVNE